MEKSHYFAELYLKNIMLKSGKKHDIVRSKLDGRAGHWQHQLGWQPVHCCSLSSRSQVPTHVCRYELGNPESSVFINYMSRRTYNGGHWCPFRYFGMTSLHQVIIERNAKMNYSAYGAFLIMKTWHLLFNLAFWETKWF